MKKKSHAQFIKELILFLITYEEIKDLQMHMKPKQNEALGGLKTATWVCA